MKTSGGAHKYLLLVLALLFGLHNYSYGQFKENVRKSYLCYNKARLAMATGKTDSAAIYMEQSIRLNNQNVTTRYDAWDIFMKAGRYHAALADIGSFYRNKELPDGISFFFGALDSTTLAVAKRDKEVQLFISSYDSLKGAHRKLYSGSNLFKELVNTCHDIDQFARGYAEDLWNSGDTTKSSWARIIGYADKENIRVMGDYLKIHSLPASSEDPTVQQTSCFVLFQHWIRDTATYSNYPGWQTIHDSVLKNVYDGRYDARQYVNILESQNFIYTQKLSFGLYTNKAPTPGHPNMRKPQAEIDDIAHVDQRRKMWLQPTLYEDGLINNFELQLPAEYKR